ncbi:hypothetical protein V6N12_054458 [Hibiscus sabdariffa]|uniref:Uncharacterized protein n=1 Tax=Hibiscus sabdariffa TaxID=183260 RepID=A0ABR2D0T2_9ROSI
MFANGESRDRYWWRKRRDLDSKNSKIENSQPIVTQKVHRRVVEGIIDEDKVAILKSCVVGFSRKPGMITDLAREFRKIERARFQVETCRINHIDEELDVRVGDLVYSVRVTEIEETIRPKCDCCCVLMDEEELDTLEAKDSGQPKHVTREVSEMTCSMDDTVVSNSILSKGTIEKMCEDARIRDIIVYELKVQRCDGSEQAGVVSGPVVTGPLNNERVKLAKKVEYKGKQRKVHMISEVMQLALSLNGKESTNAFCMVCVGGDFNAVLRVDERRGCVLSMRGVSVFNEFVEEVTLVDLPLQVDEIDEMENKLDSGELSFCEIKRKRELHTQLWSISRLRESMWRQKSRAIWLAEGLEIRVFSTVKLKCEL